MEKNKKIPQLFSNNKKKCCGCTACCAICPVDAISMEVDAEGFEYPKIDGKKCIKCYMCVKVCAFS